MLNSMQDTRDRKHAFYIPFILEVMFLHLQNWIFFPVNFAEMSTHKSFQPALFVSSSLCCMVMQ